MTSLKKWIEMKIEDGDINYFEYDNFKDIEKMNEGGFGIVYRADWSDGGIKVAFKTLLNMSTIDEDQKEKFLKELKLLRQVNTHPNINQFLGVTRDLVHDNYIIVLQYANQGNLREYLKKNFLSLQWKDKAQMALDITCGLKYLHSKQIIHRDLHAKNIVVNNGTLMITDLGLSKQQNEINSNTMLLGMSAYIEPQCFIKNNNKRNKKSDIYSLGVLFWEISSGKPPFSEIPQFNINLSIINGIRETPIENTPPEYKQLYENCWKEEPNQRPDIGEVYGILIQLKLQFDNHEIIEDITTQESNINSSTVYHSNFDFNFLSKNNQKGELESLTSALSISKETDLKNSQIENDDDIIYVESTKNDNTLVKGQSAIGIDTNETKAFEWCLKSAENGFAMAQNDLGIRYQKGIGTDKNEIKAFEWYTKSAENGVAMAQYKLSHCYINGIGTDKNETKAFQWCLKSAENGYVDAQHELGIYYSSGIGTDKNETKAFEWYFKLAENGVAIAQNGLGTCYQNGIGIDKNEIKAFEWYLKSAENGVAMAQFNLGACYQNGIGTDKNETKAFEWFLKSAENGHTMAQNDLGVRYEKGIGTDKNKTKAFEWYLKSAENGFAIAQNNLGAYYQNGIGTDKNETKAFEWYLKSAENGVAMAQYNLSRCYINGTGTDKNETKAFQWCLKSAENGYAIAQNDLGACYQNGIGTDKNETKAFEWYTKSAENGVAIAQYNLSCCYINGTGTDKNETKAFQWCLKSAENGYVDAQYELSIYYSNGIGTDKNETKAFELYQQLAEKAEKGDADAQYALACLYGNKTESI